MIIIPVRSGVQAAFVIVLEDENLQRMKIGDPATIPLRDCPIADLAVKDVELWICYEEDVPGLMKLFMADLIRHLSRGWKMVGDDGSLPRIRKVKP